MSPIPRHDLAVRLAKLEADIAASSTLVLSTPEQEQWASEQLDKVAEKRELADTERVELKAPSLKSCQDVDLAFRPLIQACDKLTGILKEALAQSALRRAALEQELADKAAQAAQEGRFEEASAIMASAPTQGTPKGVSLGEVWLWEIVDPSAVPSNFMVPSAELIDAAMAASVKNVGAPTPIPGVRFYKGVSVKRTGKRGKK